METIYEIDQAIRSCCDAETGEVLNEEALEALQMERDAKLEGIALYIKELSQMAEAIRAEERSLAERRRAKEARVEGLKSYLSRSLNGQKFETARVRLSFRASTGVLVTDAQALTEFLEAKHDECIRYAAPELDKSKLGALLKSGAKVPGAELESRINLQIK